MKQHEHTTHPPMGRRGRSRRLGARDLPATPSRALALML